MEQFFENMSPATMWMILGIGLVMFEVFIAPAMGFLFAGLGGLTLGGLLAYGVITIDELMLQVAVWFGITIIWAMVLWVPLKRARKNKAEEYNDMVGSHAIAGKKLVKGKLGDVTWSGVTMKARVDESSEDEKIEPGTDVTIVSVEGGVLFVK